MLAKTSRAWFIGVFLLFACRGLLMSTWSNQGPAVKGSLALDNSAMGLYQMLISLGSILGVIFAGRLLHKFGSRYASLFAYLVMAIGLIGLAVAVTNHDLTSACIFTALVGAPFGVADFANNFEAGEIDRQSGRNQVPMLHFGYSAAVLLGAALTSALISARVSTANDFIGIALVVAVVASIGALMIPKQNGKVAEEHHEDAGAATKVIDVLRNPRYRKIVTIAFAFIVAGY